MTKLQKLLLLSITTFAAISTIGCSSHNDIVSISDAHGYNTNYGLIEDERADRQIQAELVAMSLPTEIEIDSNMNADWTTTLEKDPDAFYAHEYVPQPEVITYKYKFDTKFYDHAEWRIAEN